jgi:hypothetical protein
MASSSNDDSPEPLTMTLTTTATTSAANENGGGAHLHNNDNDNDAKLSNNNNKPTTTTTTTTTDHRSHRRASPSTTPFSSLPLLDSNKDGYDERLISSTEWRLVGLSQESLQSIIQFTGNYYHTTYEVCEFILSMRERKTDWPL